LDSVGVAQDSARVVGGAVLLLFVTTIASPATPKGPGPATSGRTPGRPEPSAPTGAARPNVLILLTDDQTFVNFTRGLMPATFAGLVLGLFGAGMALGSLIGGVLADRWGRRSTLLLSNVLLVGGAIALGFTMSPAPVAGLATVFGLCNGVGRPAFSAVDETGLPPRACSIFSRTSGGTFSFASSLRISARVLGERSIGWRCADLMPYVAAKKNKMLARR
jgi:MFS family permease